MISLSLQLPPSYNQATRNVPGKGRVLTERAKQWYQSSEWVVLAWKAKNTERITLPYHFRLFLPKLMRGDITNRVKMAEDLLVKHGLTPDDHHAQTALPIRSLKVGPDNCVVEVERATSFFPTEWLERWAE